jgi:hypothetical protein
MPFESPRKGFRGMLRQLNDGGNMKNNPNKLWIIVLLLGWLFDFLFWEHPIGVNFAIFSTLCLVGGFGFLLLDGLRPAKRTLWLLVPFLFFAMVTVLRQEPLTIFLAYTFTILSLVLLVNSYLGGGWIEYGISDYVTKSTYLVDSMFKRAFQFNQQTRKEHVKNGGAISRLPIGAIFRGLLITLPIIILFTSMLASADLVFDQKLTDFLDKFESEDMFEYIGRTFYILVCAYLMAGVFLHAASESGDEKMLVERAPFIKPFLGFTEASIILGSVSILFLIFVTIQFQYFFGGEANIGVQGFTYSEYARRGFNELINVAFISLVMIIGLSKFTRRESELQRRIYSGLCVLLVTLVLVILVSAYQRIELGIDWHGYSRLRLYPRIFLVWLGILFAAIVALEAFRLEKYFTFAFLLASLAFGASLVTLNVDREIVKYNAPRVLAGKNLNTTHLSSLSTDAIPALVDEFRSAKFPNEIHEGFGAILYCYLYSYDMIGETKTIEEDWQSFNFSRWQARKALEDVSAELDGYTLLKLRYPRIVRTPGAYRYECGT